MKTSQAKLNANKKYQSSLDEITIRVEKGQKTTIQMIAKLKNMSVNAYITSLIMQDMQKISDNTDNTQNNKD